jgi:hypothetical protein
MNTNGERLTPYRIVSIPRFDDPRGTLSAIEGEPVIPFNPARFFYIYGVGRNAVRGCHALKRTEELIIALAGSFTITVDDGHSKTDFLLNRPDQGIYIPPLVWHELHDFAPGTVCGVLASKPYDSDGYYREYNDFLIAVRRSSGTS